MLFGSLLFPTVRMRVLPLKLPSGCTGSEPSHVMITSAMCRFPARVNAHLA